MAGPMQPPVEKPGAKPRRGNKGDTLRPIQLTLPASLGQALTTGNMAGLSAKQRQQAIQLRQQYGNALRQFDAGRDGITPMSTFMFLGGGTG